MANDKAMGHSDPLLFDDSGLARILDIRRDHLLSHTALFFVGSHYR